MSPTLDPPLSLSLSLSASHFISLPLSDFLSFPFPLSLSVSLYSLCVSISVSIFLSIFLNVFNFVYLPPSLRQCLTTIFPFYMDKFLFTSNVKLLLLLLLLLLSHFCWLESFFLFWRAKTLLISWESSFNKNGFNPDPKSTLLFL